MKKRQLFFGWLTSVLRFRVLIGTLVIAGVFFFAFQSSQTASAVTTVPTLMNFQGRLGDASGSIKSNGTYNMRLRLFTASSGGTAVWTEDRLVSASNGVQVTNGLFSIQLGSISPIAASLFASGALYLEVELPTPATATTSSPSWTEGAMTPRNQMATSAYAYNAETLDGLDSSAFAAATGSGSYIQNGSSPQTANFNISGNGTIATNLNVGGSTTVGSLRVGTTTNQQVMISAGPTSHGVEIGRTDGTSSTPFIDLHSGATATDYDARIIATGGTGANGGGSLSLTATSTNITGSLQTGGTTRMDASGNLSNIGTYSSSGNITTSGGVLSIQGAGTSSFTGSVSVGGTVKANLTTWGSSVVMTAPASDTYYKIATLPTSSSSTYDTTAIEGVMGGWMGNTKSTYTMRFWNRTAFGYRYSLDGGVQSGARIVAYQEADGSTSIYGMHAASQFTTNSYNIEQGINVTVYQNPASTTVAPTGTLVFDSSSATYAPNSMLDSSNNFNVAGGLMTGGTSRITSAGVLQNVTADANILTSGTLATGRLSGSYTGITGTGALTTGSIGSGFGTISTGNNITTTATVQGGTVNATTALQTAGTTRIDSTGNLTNIVNITSTGTLSNVAVNSKGYATTNTSATFSGQWTRLGVCTMTVQYQDCRTQALIVSTSDGGSNDRAMVDIRAKQQNPMATAPYISVRLYDTMGITPSDITAVTTTNDGSSTVVELWGRINATYRVWNVSPQVNGGTNQFTWQAGQGFSAALPAGTTTASAFSDLDMNGVLINGTSVISSSRILQNVSTDANILTSGTVAAARLSGSYTNITAVGTLTSLATSGQITSTVATGTAPLVIASTTKVTNLNADLLDGLDSTAFAAASGSTNYIQNNSSPQSASFNITGTGQIAGTLSIGGAANSGKLSVQSDTPIWTARTGSDAGATWNGVAYGGGMYVAVGANTGNSRVMSSPDGITWTSRTAATSGTWSSVTFGNGRFVAVTSSGGIMYSLNGTAWTFSGTYASHNWSDVAYGNGLFVVVASSGTNRIMTSPDGITWTARTSPQTNQWYGLTYGNGLFVAVSIDGTNRVMTSPDGITWTGRTAATASTWYDVTYGNGLYVAIGDTGVIMTSPDGINWTSRTAPEANQWWSIAYGNGLFVATALNGTNRLMISRDGITWTPQSATAAATWRSITFGGGKFVAGGNLGNVMTGTMASALSTEGAINVDGEASVAGSATIGGDTTIAGALNVSSKTTVTATSDTAFRVQNADNTALFTADTLNQRVKIGEVGSSDARLYVEGDIEAGTWSYRTAINATWTSITKGNGTYVAVASGGTSRIMTSTDGTSWTARTAPEANAWNSVTYGNGLFVAVASTGTNRVMTSPDGITWTARAGLQYAWNSVTYDVANGTYAAVGVNGAMVSTNGITWSIASGFPSGTWNSVAWNSDDEAEMVAVASTGSYVMTSTDGGYSWTAQTPAAASAWKSVTYGNGRYVAVASSGTDRVMYSTNGGVTWVTATAPSQTWNTVSFSYFNGYTSGNSGLFVAAGDSGAGMTSKDGITWTTRTHSLGINALTYGDPIFIGIGPYASIAVLTPANAITTNGAMAVNGAATIQGINNQLAPLLQVKASSGATIFTVASPKVNTSVSSADASVTFDNMVGSTQNVIAFNVGGTNRANLRADSIGNVVLNGTSGGRVYLNAENPTGGVQMAGPLFATSMASSGSNAAICWNSSTLSIGDCPGAPADYAEYYPVEGDVRAAELVATSSNTLTYEAKGFGEDSLEKSLGMKRISILKKAVKGDSGIGIVSTAPNQIIGEDVKDAAPDRVKPIALNGRVPLKVNDEGGAIRAGDQIGLSSVAGEGTKAYVAGKTFAVALEDLDGESGEIMVYVQTGYYGGRTTGDVVQGAGDLQVAGSVFINSNLNVTGATKLKTLVVESDATFKGEVIVLGRLVTQGIEINGHVVTGGESITAQSNDASGITGLTVTAEGNDTTGTLTITLDANAQIPGAIDPENGLALVNATFAKKFGAQPKVMVSAANANASKLGAYSNGESETGFSLSVITLPQQGKAYKFTYWVTQ